MTWLEGRGLGVGQRGEVEAGGAAGQVGWGQRQCPLRGRGNVFLGHGGGQKALGEGAVQEVGCSLSGLLLRVCGVCWGRGTCLVLDRRLRASCMSSSPPSAFPV